MIPSRASVRCGVAVCIAAAALTSWVAACATTSGCDAADCSSGVFLDAPQLEVDHDELITIRACVSGTCGVQRRNSAGGQIEVRVPENADEVPVTVTMEDRSGRELARGAGTARVQLERPNGDDCPPTCRVVHVRLTGGRLEDVT